MIKSWCQVMKYRRKLLSFIENVCVRRSIWKSIFSRKWRHFDLFCLANEIFYFKTDKVDLWNINTICVAPLGLNKTFALPGLKLCVRLETRYKLLMTNGSLEGRLTKQDAIHAFIAMITATGTFRNQKILPWAFH